MQTKNRKIKEEELELWKKVTEHDTIIGRYATSVEENIIHQKTSITSKKYKDNLKVHMEKSILFLKLYLGIYLLHIQKSILVTDFY